MASNTPLVLVIRDGWGENPHPEHDRFNAVKLAATPVADRLMAEWPTTLIETSCVRFWIWSRSKAAQR